MLGYSGWGLHAVCLTEAQIRKMLEINISEYEYIVAKKGGSKGTWKGSDVAIMIRSHTDLRGYEFLV